MELLSVQLHRGSLEPAVNGGFGDPGGAAARARALHWVLPSVGYSFGEGFA
ncbi:hypothetical protein [Synechococcus sp. RedBA-s]|uniref:hypothetical protein n=1 Tax=Synechococcus sp. RedBA-s TaxID=2823741 RepID=UPI0037DA1B2B